MLSPEEFTKHRYYIHINSKEEAKALYSYYEAFQVSPMYNTSTISNCLNYPYLYMAYDGIHGYGRKQDDKLTIEYDEWYAMIEPSDFKESDKPLSFLFD